ncbi:major tail protein [Solibacillus silvestris]
MAENKVRFGLKNVHYAVATEGVDGTLTYGAPVRYPGAVSIVLDPRGERSDFFADDGVYFTSNSNNGYEGTYEAAEVPFSFRTDVLGDIVDASGVAMENGNATPKTIALLFEFNGDKNPKRFMLPKVIVSRPSTSGSTTTENTEPSTQELSFVATKDHRGYPKYYTTPDVSPEAFNAWYDAVYEPTLIDTETP